MPSYMHLYVVANAVRALQVARSRIFALVSLVYETGLKLILCSTVRDGHK